jgi:hypothetical protein
MRLFQLLARLGRPAAVPEVVRDPEYLPGWVTIGEETVQYLPSPAGTTPPGSDN